MVCKIPPSLKTSSRLGIFQFKLYERIPDMYVNAYPPTPSPTPTQKAIKPYMLSPTVCFDGTLTLIFAGHVGSLYAEQMFKNISQKLL